MGLYQGSPPLSKGCLVYLGRRGLERLCSGDQLALQEHGGGKVTFICSRLREGAWRHERFEKGEGFLTGQLDCAPMARRGRVLRAGELASFLGAERVRRGRLNISQRGRSYLD